MINFFQSPLREDIKTIVYGEQSFHLTLFDKDYFGIIKEKKIWPLSMSWFQTLGIELPTHNPQRVREEINKIQKDFGGKRWHMFFQWWIINEILTFYNISHRSHDFAPGMRATRHKLEQWLQHQTGLIPSFRENMPLATVVIDTSKHDDDLLNEMNSGAKSHVRKAINKQIDFHIAEPQEYASFYEERHKVSQLKGFNIIRQETYIKLMNYLTENKCGNIFIASKDGVLLWWSIAVYQGDTLTYLYGFSNRDERFRNVGVHQFIKFKMFTRAREQGIQYMDLFGGAPTGFPEHPLTSVSAFKESLGGTKVERYGNYDIILNPSLYYGSKTLYQWRK